MKQPFATETVFAARSKCGLVALPFLLFTISAPDHGVYAQETNAAPAEAPDQGALPQETAERIRSAFTAAAFPASGALAYVLATLPEVEGRRLPFSVKIDIPPDPNEPIAIVHTCLFGAQICEPFFTACEAFGGIASETTCELPDPVPPASPAPN